jgi:ferredoxin
MSATIYYFTGTGNSLHVARTIAEQLEGSRVVNIARSDELKNTDIKSDVTGIVFPVYYWNMPTIVQEFVKRLVLGPEDFVFGVATCGGKAGCSLLTLDRLLRERGSHLSAGYSLVMPDNAYIGANLITPPAEREEAVRAADEKLGEIIASVKRKERRDLERAGGITSKVLGSLGSNFATYIYRLPRQFNVTDRCSHCGACVKICPVGNIKEVDNRMTWGNNCTHCLACFHWCPNTAVEIGRRSAAIARYHHPAVTINDMKSW